MASGFEDLFNSPEYKVKASEITLGTGHVVYRFSCRALDISDMLFTKRSDGMGYEPCIYDFSKSDEGRTTGKVIKKGTIAHAFIQSIRYTERTVNARTKKIDEGNLSILQWYFSIHIVNSAIEYKKKRWDLEVSRQFGKTHLASRIAGFLPVFAPLYADMTNDRWWQIIASYNDDSVKEIFDFKVKPLIFKNIELYNKLYPSEQIIFGKHKTENYVNDKNKIELRRMIGNEAIPHSYVVAISTNTVKDGKSSDWMWCDEAWRTNAKEFRRGILPFLGSTGGDLLVSGITTSDTDNLMYNIHFEDKNSIPLISSCFTTYNYLLLDFPQRAENLKEMAEEEFSVSGIDSNESQTNYILSWDVLESGKFYTLDLMKKNKNLTTEDSILKYDEIEKEYRVAGLDLATINDYCVMTIWDVYKVNKIDFDELGRKKSKVTWKNTLRDVIVYNQDRQPISAESIAKMVAKDCNTNKIDMILIDGTASQKTHNEWIYKEIKELKLNTLVCPYDFSGSKNKVILMSFFEQMLRSGLTVLGSEKDVQNHSGLKLLYKELLKLFKGYENGKQNIQYKAKGKGNTDDATMSAALGCYCVPYIENLEKNGKFIEINSYRFRARLTKFNNIKKEKIDEKMIQYMNIL